MAKNYKYYWFIFEDGTEICARGFSAREMKIETSKHGKLVKKILA